jgi:hypothetical protein
MADESEHVGGVATGDEPSVMEDQLGATGGQPSEDEMRAAYEAELNRISSADMILQTAVSLINIGGRRLGLIASGGASADSGAAAPERDLEQVRDAIDGARALMPILERHMSSRELGPLRDAISQLQMAYAREAQGVAEAAPASSQAHTEAAPASQVHTPPSPASPSEPPAGPAEKQGGDGEGEQQKSPGPAQASGRLWVPGR